jgi:hypothetical protein
LSPSAVSAELAAAAAAAVFAPVRDGLAALGVDDDIITGILARVSHGPGEQDEVLRLRERALGRGAETPIGLFERYVLLRGAVRTIDRIPALPVPAGVQQLLLDEFLWMTRPQERELPWFTAGEYVFSALSKLVTLRRFPAGQLHWEVAGLARSALWRVRTRDLPRFLRGVLALGGVRPAFVPHLAWRRRHIVLSEREHKRSLCFIAQALELQPHIRGFVAEAWFYSPDTAVASPHLAWAPRLFEDGDGVVVVTGRAGVESGVFESRARRRLAEQGGFRPTLGLVIWPRAAMLRWAHDQGCW